MPWSDSFNLIASPDNWQISDILECDFIKIQHNISKLNKNYFTGQLAQIEIVDYHHTFYNIQSISAEQEVILDFQKPEFFTDRRLAFKANAYPLLGFGQHWDWKLIITPYSSSATNGGTSSNVWTPTQIQTQLWLDANEATSILKDGNNLISQWNDISGNGNHLYQSTNSKKPLLATQSVTSKRMSEK